MKYDGQNNYGPLWDVDGLSCNVLTRMLLNRLLLSNPSLQLETKSLRCGIRPSLIHDGLNIVELHLTYMTPLSAMGLSTELRRALRS
jgi:hypothetical protein